MGADSHVQHDHVGGGRSRFGPDRRLGYELYQRKEILAQRWAAAFGALGAVLTITGAHMTLTWPLSNIHPYDNIIFGEPSLAFGIMFLGMAVVSWAEKTTLASPQAEGRGSLMYLRRLIAPMSVFAAVMGLGMIGIAIVGWRYDLFYVPVPLRPWPEPIAGPLSTHPLIETTFICGLYTIVGLGLVLFPIAIKWFNSRLLALIGVLWGIGGIAFALFGALNYFTHLGLIHNTGG